MAASEVTVPATPTNITGATSVLPAPENACGICVQGRRDLRLQLSQLRRQRRIVVDVPLVQAHRTERQTAPEGHRPAIGDDDLRRPAADVHHHRPAARHFAGEGLANGTKSQLGLAITIDHRDGNPQDLLRRFQEGGGVGRASQRLGAHRRDGRAVMRGGARVDLQGHQCCLDPFLSQASRIADSPSQPGYLRGIHQHLGVTERRARPRPRHQQQRGVGAHVDGGDGSRAWCWTAWEGLDVGPICRSGRSRRSRAQRFGAGPHEGEAAPPRVICTSWWVSGLLTNNPPRDDA